MPHLPRLLLLPVLQVSTVPLFQETSVAPSLSLLMESWTFPESAVRYCTKASTHTLRNSERSACALTPPPDWPEGGVQMICRVSGEPARGVIVTSGEPASSPDCALIWKMCVKFDEAWKPEGSLNFQR